MNFAQIRAFHALAQTGSFTAASEKLFLTQPAITLQLKALQQHYGITLLHRKGRHIQLTDAGEELFNLTKRLFMVVRETDDFLNSMDNLEQGHLTIGADSPLRVMKLMADFRKQYPGISISITLGNTERVCNDILQYQSDVAVVTNFNEHPKISSHSICSSPLVVIVSNEHKWANRESINIEELQDVAMIQREQGSSTRACFELALKEVNIQPDFILEVDTREAVREAVAQNIGMSVVPQSEIGHDFRLHTLNIKNKEVTQEEFIIFLKDRKDSRIVSAFVDHIQ